jgi:ribose/xylose/arabinose/galactoside ABC-type transport system permease subunit
MSTNEITTPSPSPVSSRAHSKFNRESFAAVATAGALVLVFVVYAFWLGTRFYNVSHLAFDISRSAPQLVLSVAVAVCLCGRQFDLSVASIATGGCFVSIALYLRGDVPMAVAIIVTLLAGVVGGLLNGFLVTRLRVNAFIATLGTGGLFAGFTVVYSSGEVIGPTATTKALPSWFSGAGSMGDFQNKVPLVIGYLLIAALAGAILLAFDQRFPGPPTGRPIRIGLLGALGVGVVLLAWWLKVPNSFDWMIVIVLTLTLLVWIGMKYTSTGHAIYAVGGSESAAAFAGIRTRRISLGLFIFSGMLASLAGVLISSQQGSASPGVADPLLLPAYAGAFLSTVILSRGRFHIWGTVAGSIALVYVTSGLVVGGVPYTWTQVINGAVLITTVALSTFLQRNAASR